MRLGATGLLVLLYDIAHVKLPLDALLCAALGVVVTLADLLAIEEGGRQVLVLSAKARNVAASGGIPVS